MTLRRLYLRARLAVAAFNVRDLEWLIEEAHLEWPTNARLIDDLEWSLSVAVERKTQLEARLEKCQ